MTETIILNDIPFEPDFDKIAETLHVREGTSMAAELRELMAEAQGIARPKALYRLVGVDERLDSSVVLDGRSFESNVMRVNLEKANRVFLYIATCGRELYDWKHAIDDAMRKFCADMVNSAALFTARDALLVHLTETFHLGKTATMNPGSLEDWPITAQTDLFEMLGDTDAMIGVRLLDSMLMLPSQTVSGLLFETETDYVNCQLCPREHCPNRRAPYDAALLQEKYASA